MTVFLMRNWQAVLGGAIVAVLAVILWIRTDQRDDARQGWAVEKAAYAKFRTDARAEAAAMQARYLANARRVETEQNAISQESSNAYQARIAELRARVERLRVNQGVRAGGGGSDLPRVSIAASGSDVAASQDRLPPEDAIIATETAIRLDELQRWLRRVSEVPR